MDVGIGEDHPARTIWELVWRLDLGRFYEGGAGDRSVIVDLPVGLPIQPGNRIGNWRGDVMMIRLPMHERNYTAKMQHRTL